MPKEIFDEFIPVNVQVESYVREDCVQHCQPGKHKRVATK